MANITAALVKELREKTGAGVMDAKKALVEVEGDMEKAVELLREKGMAKAAKKADRVAAEGLTSVYVDGNVAAIVEVNAETDFVAKNAQFVDLVNETAKVIAEGKPANNEEALALKTAAGDTLEAAYVNATATIGEKISFRRFALVEKADKQVFGAYQHNGGKIGVVTVLEGENTDEALAKQLAMHVAAMNPSVLSYKELSEEFIHDELAQMNHKIEQDNESRTMVDKPALPLLKYGSQGQLTDEVVAQAEEDIKAELKAEGKPEKIWDKIIPGKMARFFLDNTKVDQQYTLLSQVYIMDDSKTVEAYMESVNGKVISFVRFEVGEGIEKAANDFENEVAATMAAALNK
ncbi:translation elongation factor Ts [Streptococcus mutans]|uniref:translation elongation factor Ts n=1 Tax=Streptococcus mutans TaxID=1309 RepID=UPI000A3C36CC|nr:translation elongation factor Ts [Streptococcus mutans]ARS63412.1 translation elongation factor Ts [Streptococcus mutans]MCB4926457.1 translation elongation factor Ts [Streptococcus mutans]